MSLTETFRTLAININEASDYPEREHESYYQWYETAPGVVKIGNETVVIVESTNFNVNRTINNLSTYRGDGDPDWLCWVLVDYKCELYRLTGVYNSWEGTDWNGWKRVKSVPVTTYEYMEVDE